jgi:predicted ester cyclase
VFDNYLAKAHGYGPVIDAIEHDHQFAHLTGYNRDPAWQFPALRRLLPAQSDVVAEDGSVACAGLHFEDDILSPWAGQQVTVRRSLHSDAAAYVYVDDEILCLAMARELRRADGRYRTHLPERMGR